MHNAYNTTPYIIAKESTQCLSNLTLGNVYWNVSHTLNNTYSNTTLMTYHYKYSTCSTDMIAKCEYEAHTTCICIKDLLNDCLPTMQNAKCENIYSSIAILQLLSTIMGIISNGTVIRFFRSRPTIQKRFPNILLYIQAITDMIGCLVYGLPVSVILYMEMFYGNSHFLSLLAVTMLCLSSSSSVMIYTLIASERCLATIRPLWHRANIRVSHLWRATWLIWLLAVVGSVLNSLSYAVFKMWEISLCMYTCLGLMIIAVTFTQSLTFYKALQAVRQTGKIQRTESTRQNQGNIRNRKQFRLVVIVLVMYIFFLLGFIPILALDPDREDHHPTAKIMYLLFQLTSVINPCLTLGMKEDFKIASKKLTRQSTRPVRGNTVNKP